MRLLPIALALWLFATPISFADSREPSMPALGFFIVGESGADVLDTIIPELILEEVPPVGMCPQ